MPPRDLVADYQPITSLPYRPGSIAWRVMGEPHVFVGASRALLLQTSHPKVAKAVGDHSTYARDPLGRLFRTFDTVSKLGFGDEVQVKQMISRMAKRHAPIKGDMPNGDTYDGLDPVVGLWVHATLIDTAVQTWELAHGPLSADDKDRLIAETGLFAQACGIPADLCPRSWQEFADYVARTIEEDLCATPDGDDIARNSFAGLLPVIGPAVAAYNRSTAAVLFPERLGEMYGMRAAQWQQVVVRTGLKALGLQMRMTPDRVRHLGVDLICRYDLLERLERINAQRRRNRRTRAAGGRTASHPTAAPTGRTAAR